MKSDEPWLEIKNAEVYLHQKRIFKDISLRLMPGDQTVVLGPNGAGKSTLIRLIRREIYPLVKPGSIFKLFGSEEVNLRALRRRIGVISPELEKRMNPGVLTPDVIASGFFGSLGISKRQLPSPKQKERIEELIDNLRLTKLTQSRFGELSDGQRKRVLIARALVHNPEVLVLDEPTSGLDLYAKYSLMKILEQLTKDGKTLLIVTHQIENVIKAINKVVFIKNGAITDIGSVNEQMSSKKLSELFHTPLKVISANGYWQALPDT